MKPPAFWKEHDPERRAKLKIRFERYYDKLDKFRYQCRKWGIGIYADVTIEGRNVVLSRCGASVTIPINHGPAYLRAAISKLNAATCPAASHPEPGTEESDNA